MDKFIGCGLFRWVRGMMLIVVMAGLTMGDRTMAQGLDNSRAEKAAARVLPGLRAELAALGQDGVRMGNPVFVRVFKDIREMEVWIKNTETGKFVQFKTYRVAAMSGRLGPKQKEGDLQAPEGFYFVNRARMNPVSRFHLAFNIGYPNKYDRAHGRTGTALMVHGNRVSIGCFAMTDRYVEEIYTICDQALLSGQRYFRVHCFPFKMTASRMAKAKSRGDQWYPFWQNLQAGYDHFEKYRVPPNTRVVGKKYHFSK